MRIFQTAMCPGNERYDSYSCWAPFLLLATLRKMLAFR